MPAELILYTNPSSRGRVARWMLEEVGAEYDAVALDFEEGMRTPEFLGVNPMGKVPVIVHRGQVVTEAAAICAYLADAFPEAGLAPRPEERASYYRWLFFAAGPLEHAIANRTLGTVTEGHERMVGYGTYDLTVDVLERAVSAHPYVAGDRFTAADVYVGSHLLWGLQFKSLPWRDAFEEYWARLSRREAFVRASALDDAEMPAGDV